MASHSNGTYDIQKLRRAIRACYPGLPENQRKVADCFLQISAELPLLSVTEVERRAGVSKATVVRLAQSLGFSGFMELRRKLRSGIQAGIGLAAQSAIPESLQRRETLSLVARQDVKNITQTVNNIDPGLFSNVAARIVRSSHVYTLGLGISSLMSQVMAYSLNQVAVPATPLVHDYATFVEQLPFLSPRDLLIAFSFPPYSRETVDAVTAAASRRIPVIGITDRETSPITFSCLFVLPIRSKNMLFTNSFSAISVVINALVTEVALKNRAKALRMLKVTDRLLQQAGHYTTE
jgi:DNA-binding MurR/RpiR family transcriptional regulator